MALLKEDGSLDIESINKLPINEWMNFMGELTDEQFEEYTRKASINESLSPFCSEGTNYTTTIEEMESNGFIELTIAINNLREKFGIQ